MLAVVPDTLALARDLTASGIDRGHAEFPTLRGHDQPD